MDEIKILPLRIFDFLFCYVFSDAVEHLAGVRRSQGFAHGGDFAVDLQASMALGLPRHALFRRRRAVCLRLLQCDAHLHRAWISHHDFIQAPFLVRVLPHGNHDSAHMPD